jgi:hypothetical protein
MQTGIWVNVYAGKLFSWRDGADVLTLVQHGCMLPKEAVKWIRR